jgi:hypothetical protein
MRASRGCARTGFYVQQPRIDFEPHAYVARIRQRIEERLLNALKRACT